MQLASYKDIGINYSSIRIQKYMMDLILPKCNLIFGKTFSSVYFQLAMNTNNKPNEVEWKRNKCWLEISTIAKNTNCNDRTIYKIIKDMQQIGLVEKTYHGKLYMFELKNNNLIDISDISKLNIQIEKKLISLVKDINKKENLIDKFSQLNEITTIRRGYCEFKDLNLLRKWIVNSERIQSGSSLMFITFFAKHFINSNIDDYEINGLSEQQRAICIGCSQSTVSRYLKSFEKYQYITITRKGSIIPNKISINKEMLMMNEIPNLDIIKNEIYKCPVCGKEIDSIKKVNSHIKRCKDELHSMFKDLQDVNKTYTYEDINNLYNDNKHKFDAIQNEKDESKKKTNSLALQLVKYYYGLTNTKCPSWAKETNIVKSHLNSDMSADEVMEVMKYMAKRGQQDLRFFNTSINEALTLNRCRSDIKKEGTDAYLIKLYYKGMGQMMTDRVMLQGVKKISELTASGYDYIQIKTIIEYMIKKRCPNFNFIVTMANEALTNSKNKDEMTKAYTIDELVLVSLDGVLEYGNIMLKDCNYDIAKKEIILRLKDDICSGKVDLTRVNKVYYKFAVALADEIYKRNMYTSDFTEQQWLNKIQLNQVQLNQVNQE